MDSKGTCVTVCCFLSLKTRIQNSESPLTQHHHRLDRAHSTGCTSGRSSADQTRAVTHTDGRTSSCMQVLSRPQCRSLWVCRRAAVHVRHGA
jgi:hypothetical protein